MTGWPLTRTRTGKSNSTTSIAAQRNSLASSTRSLETWAKKRMASNTRSSEIARTPTPGKRRTSQSRPTERDLFRDVLKGKWEDPTSCLLMTTSTQWMFLLGQEIPNSLGLSEDCRSKSMPVERTCKCCCLIHRSLKSVSRSDQLCSKASFHKN